jgi:septal ring factor EnvC (AmiA/AmiB activator)
MISEENHSGVLFFLLGLIALVMAGVTMSMLSDSSWIRRGSVNELVLETGRQEITQLRIRLAELEYRIKQPRIRPDVEGDLAGIEESLTQSRDWSEKLNEKKNTLKNEILEIERQIREIRTKR